MRRELERKLAELIGLPCTSLEVIENVSLEDGVATPVPHKLGRPAKWARESCVTGAVTSGVVTRVTDTAYDQARYVVLQADGFGATVSCSVVVL